MNHELNEFIRTALSKGLSRDKIKEVLLKASWPEDEVSKALSYFADVDFPLPVPRRKPYMSAREAFLYLLMFLTLYVSAFSFGALIYEFINKAFPDTINAYGQTFSRTAINNYLASLIIAFPIYMWISGMMNKKIKKDADVRGSKVRKWLTYLTLFITAGVIIGDLITLLNRLFNGELTTRFGLKFLTVLVIAGVIFLYYLSDLRKEEKSE